MLKINKFSPFQDIYVLLPVAGYAKGATIPAGTLEKSVALKYWMAGRIRNTDTSSYTRHQLSKLSFGQLKELGKPFGITDRSKAKLISELLEVL